MTNMLFPATTKGKIVLKLCVQLRHVSVTCDVSNHLKSVDISCRMMSVIPVK